MIIISTNARNAFTVLHGMESREKLKIFGGSNFYQPATGNSIKELQDKVITTSNCLKLNNKISEGQ